VRGLIHWPPEFVLISFSLFLVPQLVRRPASWVVLLYKPISSIPVLQRVRFPICGAARFILTLWSMVSISQNVRHQACWECRLHFHRFLSLRRCVNPAVGAIWSMSTSWLALCVSQKVRHSTCQTHFTLMSCAGLSVCQNVCYTIFWLVQSVLIVGLCHCLESALSLLFCVWFPKHFSVLSVFQEVCITASWSCNLCSFCSWLLSLSLYVGNLLAKFALKLFPFFLLIGSVWSCLLGSSFSCWSYWFILCARKCVDPLVDQFNLC
jgi:hypothetical protein